MASQGNQHCANCIGTVLVPHLEVLGLLRYLLLLIFVCLLHVTSNTL